MDERGRLAGSFCGGSDDQGARPDGSGVCDDLRGRQNDLPEDSGLEARHAAEDSDEAEGGRRQGRELLDLPHDQQARCPISRRDGRGGGNGKVTRVSKPHWFLLLLLVFGGSLFVATGRSIIAAAPTTMENIPAFSGAAPAKAPPLPATPPGTAAAGV